MSPNVGLSWVSAAVRGEIRRRMTAGDLSLPLLAVRVGYSYNYLYQWLYNSGRATISLAALDAIMVAVDIGVFDLPALADGSVEVPAVTPPGPLVVLRGEGAPRPRRVGDPGVVGRSPWRRRIDPVPAPPEPPAA